MNTDMTQDLAPISAPENQAPESGSPPEKRPERILGWIALAAGILLAVMVVLCIPYFGAQEDPETIARPIHEKMEEAPETEPPTEYTEPEPDPTAEPTIPPEPNPYGRFDFQYNKNNYLLCQKQDSYPGIDVSAHQGTIDWKKVKASGIEFAIIRLGYRGYGSSGRLVEDEYAKRNLKGATEAGLPIGAYFFSQALSIQEADEEISFMLQILGDYELDMPIILDWEYISDTARTANMDARTLTDIQLHFCQIMEEKGYQPMVYFNWYQSSKYLYLSELEDYPFWLALYQDRMTYPWKVEMWQYTCTGRVPGINGDVDINVYMPS